MSRQAGYLVPMLDGVPGTRGTVTGGGVVAFCRTVRRTRIGRLFSVSAILKLAVRSLNDYK